MKKHFVRFLSAGTFVAEETVKQIESWDVSQALEMAQGITERYGAHPYGFQFITRGRTDEELDSKVIEKSGIYYINGVVETLEQVKAKENPDDRILISNMESNGWGKVVTTCAPYKWTQPFNDGDSIVSL